MTYMSKFDQNWEIFKEQHNGDKSWEFITHGWEQRVAVDHVNKLTYRYPRNQNAADKLVDEVEILRQLHFVTFNVAIPRVIECASKYSAYDYIPGDVLPETELAKLTDEQAYKIGQDLGEFFAILHSQDPEIAAVRTRKQDMSLFEYYRRRIETAKTVDFYQHTQNLLDSITPNAPQVLVHGDLHALNMVIDPINLRLSGVIDFSEVEVGDPHQDFRKIFMADERFLSPAVDVYQQQTGKDLSIDRIRTWAYVNEWANLAFFNGQTTHPTYQRALKHLMQWDEIDQISAH